MGQNLACAQHAREKCLNFIMLRMAASVFRIGKKNDPKFRKMCAGKFFVTLVFLVRFADAQIGHCIWITSFRLPWVEQTRRQIFNAFVTSAILQRGRGFESLHDSTSDAPDWLKASGQDCSLLAC
jgi:hypothetical protein